ncbi:replication initiation factor domain-containing protein [Neisseria gonorrhoeae]|uniref:replication initiation factor domain-containing protein n=2 Tax=Neisseria gonorrhoeae TaxID=485 RepID=UPI0030993097
MADALADGGAAATAVGCPPRLIGGEQNKTPNPKGAEKTENQEFQFEYFSHFVSDGKGRFIEIPLRRGRDDGAFIDQITFTIHENSMTKVTGKGLVSDTEFVVRYSELLEEILGFGITKKLPFKGKFFYQSCYQFGPDNVEYGKVHYGGQCETMLVELTAVGCNAANIGWESRLFDFLTNAIRPKITRVDIAKDFFNGEYSPNQAREDRNKGLFTCHHVKPKGECLGSDWEEDDEAKMTKGKTYGIGSRESSKYVRVYEKGKQLGDKTSTWTRFEIEFKAKDIVIPFEVLQTPGEYFGGAYPICERFAQKATRIHALKEDKVVSADRCLEWVKKQFGRAANGLKFIFPELDKAKLFELIEPSHHKLPKSLALEAYDCAFLKSQVIHEQPAFKPYNDPYYMYEYYENLEKQPEQQKHVNNEESYNNFIYDKFARLPISWA